MTEQIKKGSDDLHTGQTIRTFTGLYINVFEPDPETICIEDIAHALSNTCRFGGHTFKHFSVAEHSMNVANHIGITENLKLTALLHDASEAYMCDMPRPIKRHLGNYKDVEEKLMGVIAKKFGLIYPFPPEIKVADNVMLEWEHKWIILARDPLSINFYPDQAELRFMDYYDLYKTNI